jgi:hypothetical protein
MERKYVPTYLEIRCNCNNVIPIRTNQREEKITCWHSNCNTTIRVVMGYGKNNLTVYLKEGSNRETRVKPLSIIQ